MHFWQLVEHFHFTFSSFFCRHQLRTEEYLALNCEMPYSLNQRPYLQHITYGGNFREWSD